MIRKKSSGKLIAKGAVALLVAGVLTAGVCCMGYASRGENGKWFGNGDVKSWHWKDKTEPKEEENLAVGIGGAVVSAGENNGMSLLCAELPRAAYSANGIAEQSENAYLLTASVEPENATIEGYDWSVSYTNPASEWASANALSDVLTLTSNGNTATFTVLKEFGEQVTIKVEVIEKMPVEIEEEAQPETVAETEVQPAERKFATYTVDYSQRVYIKNLYIGGFVFSGGSKLGFRYRNGTFVMADTGGNGGVLEAIISSSEVYTIEEEYSIHAYVLGDDVRFDPKAEGVGEFVSSDRGTYDRDIYGQEIYFDLRFFDFFRIGTLSMQTYEWINYSDNFRANPARFGPTAEAKGQTIVKFNLVLEGNYSSDSVECRIVFKDYTIPVDSVEIEEGSGTIV